MDTTIVEAIPFTAWEQAVFVALFIVLVIALLFWFTKQQQNWQDFMDRQNARWQKSIDDLNNQWQKWLAEQNARECSSMEKVSISLDKLTERIDQHDGKVDNRFTDAINAVNSIKHPRQKKTEE